MSIRKLKIKNFKCFSDWFTVDFENGINILVGNNGTGKSTILEAINLVLTGTYHGKNIRNELTQYLFNKNIVENYIREVNEGMNVEPPKIIIEAYFDAEMPSFLGDGNSEKINRHSPYLSITLHKCYPYYLFGISAFPNSVYHTISRRKFSITIV